MTKTNEQTVEVTFPGSSTLEFTSIQCVPVYEPAKRGWIDLYYSDTSITYVTHNGDVGRLHCDTGRMERWYTRPSLENVINMGAKDGIGGYYFEFAKDGSIRSSCPEGSYYWGPLENGGDPEFISFSTTRDYMIDWSGDIYDQLRTFHSQLCADHEMRDDDEDCSWMYERPRLTTEERLAATEQWLAALKWRSESMPGVCDNPKNKEMHEQCIRTAEKEISRLSDDVCPECRREGVCMCYT